MYFILDNIKNKLFGLSLVFLISFLAIIISEYILVHVGSIAIAITLGFIINNLFNIKNKFIPGIDFSEKYFLSIAIILLGATFDNNVVEQLDYITIFHVVCFVVISFLVTFIIVRIFNFPSDLSILLGFGNAICGSSAIVSASAVIQSKKEYVLLSVSIINIIGVIAIIIIPLLLNLFSVNDPVHQGEIIGGSIQALGQVSATGYIIDDNVGKIAVVVKMFRILLLFPALLLLSFTRQFHKISSDFKFPYFIIGFVIIFIFNYFNFIPLGLVSFLGTSSKYFLLFSMVALGLKVSLDSIIKNGIKLFFVTLLAFMLQLLFIIQIVT